MPNSVATRLSAECTGLREITTPKAAGEHDDGTDGEDRGFHGHQCPPCPSSWLSPSWPWCLGLGGVAVLVDDVR